VISLVNLAAALVILALLPSATARVARLSRDSIAEPVRSWVRRKYGIHSRPAELVACHWCVGVWASLLTSSWAWTLIWYSKVWSLGMCIGMGLLSIPAMAYLASRMIDREDG
jgi:hypothetical protein